MKKIIFVLLCTFLSRALSAQIGCGTDAAAAAPSSYCGILTDFIPSYNITIPINFIFCQPLSGPGIFDTITKGTCDDIISFMNSEWASLSPVSMPLPSPYTASTAYTDTKIRFSYKSISHVPNIHYGSPNNNPNKPPYTITDPTALNLVFNVQTGGGAYGYVIGPLPNNYVTLVQDFNSFNLFNDGARHNYFLHEVGHALGLYHTFPEALPGQILPLSQFSNPTGIILPPAPVDDFWYEDGNVWQTTQVNNYMGYTWSQRDYLSPKQIGAIHYNLKNTPKARNMSGSCTIGADWVMYSNTYPGVIYADADLIIPQGNHVILTGCVYMKAGTRIIIEPGGKLTLNGAKISSACQVPWKGIEVQSSNGGTQYVDPITQMPSNLVGMIELNGAIVENAEIGINIGKYSATGTYFIDGGVTYPGSLLPSTTAGIVFSENTKYINNRIAVNFNPYNTIPLNSANMSYFKKDEFTITDDYDLVNTNNPYAAINIDRTFHVKIHGCNFTDRVKATSYGVRCMNGSVSIKDHCSGTSSTPSCNGTLTRSEFKGFKYGVYINSWFMNVPSTIRHAKFNTQGNSTTSGFGAIYISGVYSPEIVDCEIRSIKIPYNTSQVVYGLYLDGCDAYVVENNTFIGTSTQLTGGVFVNNSGFGANSIYNNTFNNLQQGLWAQNINYDINSTNGSGLVMNCNDFYSNCKYNIGVQTAYTGANCAGCPPIYQPGGVATTQGVINLGEDKNVRNTYGAASCTDENRFYINTQNNFVVSSHGSFQGSQYHPTPQPSCSNANELVDIVGAPTFNQKSVWCTTAQYQSFSKEALTSNIVTNRENIVTLRGIKDTQLDGGNTNHLLNLFQDVTETAGSIFDTLITKDFLSDTVLKSFFIMDDVTNPNIEDLFTKNAPVHPQVWAFIGTLGLDGTLYDALYELQFNQNKISDREIINSQLTMAHTELGLLINESVRRFLRDTTGIAYDSIAAIYNLNEIPNSQFKLADVAIATRHFTEAQDIIATLNADAANEDLCNVLGYVLQLQQDSSYLDTLRTNEAIRDYLRNIRGSDKPLLDSYVKGLLAGVYFERDLEITLQPEGYVGEEEESERRANLAEEEQGLTIESIDNRIIRLYPNPASNQLTVENNYDVNGVKIQIVDLSGKVFVEQACDKKCTIDVQILNNGVYLLNLYEKEQLLAAKKLVIIK